MVWKRIAKGLGFLLGLGSLVVGLWFTQDHWWPWLGFSPVESKPVSDEVVATPADKILVSDQAQTNLGISARPLTPQSYWKSIPVPGMVVDRPGLSDRGIVAPATAVVSRIFQVPGDPVRPGQPLFTLKLLSESLHQTQTDLFKATQDIQLAEAQKKRLQESAGAVPESRLIEVENQIARLGVAVQAYRQELLSRGFSLDQILGVAKGTFVRELTIVAPESVGIGPGPTTNQESLTHYELQDLKADLGQQVQAGQTLCLLANHQRLAIEGQAFRDETPLLERSVQERWPVEVDFQEDPQSGWGPVKQTFFIQHLGSTIDPHQRTFAFRMLLENEARPVSTPGETHSLWRFRPGQKVRIQVRIEELKNVFVVPTEAVVRVGPESFVFTQNVNTFTRRPVRVLHQDRHQTVLANDDSLPSGIYVVQSGAAQLNRMIQSSGPSGVPKGYHMHADGSLHKNGED